MPLINQISIFLIQLQTGCLFYYLLSPQKAAIGNFMQKFHCTQVCYLARQQIEK